MKENRDHSIQMVITVALKKELPLEWLRYQPVAVYTLKSLKSGAFVNHGNSSKGIMIIITGAGNDASEEAARWIRDNLTPLFVVNVGTCGLLDKSLSLGRWIQPASVSNGQNDEIKLDARLPFSYKGEIIKIDSLLTVQRASTEMADRSSGINDAVDMECYHQAKIFIDTEISFHCLKFGTDYADSDAISEFNKNIAFLEDAFIELFSFLNISENRKKISVIIPVYNRHDHIKDAVDSVLNQSVKPDDIIVIDDGSTDSTKEILKSLGDKVRLIFLPQNSGPSVARNAGVRHARNEWIAFLDSDDRWEKNKLKNQIAWLDKYPFYKIMQSEEKWIRKGTRVNPCDHHRKPSGWIWERSLERCLVSPSSVLLEKALFEKYKGFDESLAVCEDYDLWLSISRDNPVGLDRSHSVIKYGGHSDQLSSKYPAMDRFRVQSLVKQLNKEREPAFRRKIGRELSKKLAILIKGYEKRDRLDEADQCYRILRSIKENKQTVTIG